MTSDDWSIEEPVPGALEPGTQIGVYRIEALLGEDLMERWIAQVAVAPLPRGGPLRVLDPSPSGASTLPLAESIRRLGYEPVWKDWDAVLT